MNTIRAISGGAAVPLLLAACALPAGAAPSPFQWSIGGDFNAVRASTVQPVFGEIDGEFVPIDTVDFDSESDALTLGGTRFFSPVAAAAGPLARAPFLDRASSATARYFASESSSDLSPDGSDNRGLGVDLLWVSRGSGWLVATSLNRSRQDAGPLTVRNRFASIAAGRYVGERAAIRVGARRLWARADSDVFGPAKVRFDTIFAELELVGDLGARWDYALDVTARLPESGTEGATLAIRGAVFPTPALELGADISVFTANPTDRERRYGAFARWFVTDAWSAAIRYGTQADDHRAEANTDVSDWTIGVRYRF